MKFFKYLIFTFLIMLPINANAAIRMNCDGPAKINQRLTCDITTDVKITSFESTLSVESSVVFEGSIAATKFELLSSHLNLNFRSSTLNMGSIGYIRIMVPSTMKSSSFTLTLSDIKYVSAAGPKTQGTLSETVQVLTTTKTTTTTTQNTTTQSASDKTFTVTLNSNNSIENIQTKTCNTTGSNCKINLSDASNPTKEGFTFNGWGNSTTCTEGSKTSYTATNNVVLYACWQKNTAETPDEGDTLYLQTLSIEGQEIEFSKFKREYEIVVLYQIENLTISATPTKEGVNIDLQESYALEVGENTITLNLTDNDNSTTYTIKVKRLKEGEELRTPSSDATLKSIKIEGYDLNFVSNVFDYNLKVSSGTTSLDIVTELSDEYAQSIITGNSDIVDGSVIKITVKAEDGTINTYNITIEIAKGIKDYLLYIIVGSILLISIIALVIVNQSKMKKKKENKQTVKTKAPSKKSQTKGKASAAPVVKTIAPVVPQPVVKPAVTPQPVTPQPVTPKPVVPQPVVPHPVQQPQVAPQQNQPKPPEPKESVEVLDL